MEAFDVTLCVQHVFSCELDKKVRAFIEQHHKPRFLFEDTCELGRDHAVDLLSNDRVRIPSCHMFVWGSECDNFSNQNRGTRMVGEGCLEAGEGKSGETFQ